MPTNKLSDYGGVLLLKIGKEGAPRGCVIFLANKEAFAERLTDAVVDYLLRGEDRDEVEPTIIQVCTERNAWETVSEMNGTTDILYPADDVQDKSRMLRLWHLCAAEFKFAESQGRGYDKW